MLSLYPSCTTPTDLAPTAMHASCGWQSTTSVEQGAFGVDVRNYDGLIVLSDMRTGLWTFKMDGFTGWNGHDYGQPNISSVQDWDNGPEGAKKRVVP